MVPALASHTRKLVLGIACSSMQCSRITNSMALYKTNMRKTYCGEDKLCDIVQQRLESSVQVSVLGSCAYALVEDVDEVVKAVLVHGIQQRHVSNDEVQYGTALRYHTVFLSSRVDFCLRVLRICDPPQYHLCRFAIALSILITLYAKLSGMSKQCGNRTCAAPHVPLHVQSHTCSSCDTAYPLVNALSWVSHRHALLAQSCRLCSCRLAVQLLISVCTVSCRQECSLLAFHSWQGVDKSYTCSLRRHWHHAGGQLQTTQ